MFMQKCIYVVQLPTISPPQQKKSRKLHWSSNYLKYENQAKLALQQPQNIINPSFGQIQTVEYLYSSLMLCFCTILDYEAVLMPLQLQLDSLAPL